MTDFKAADTNNDGKLTQTEFMTACDKGLVTASATSGSGGRGMTGTESPHPKSKSKHFRDGDAQCASSSLRQHPQQTVGPFPREHRSPAALSFLLPLF